MNQCINLVGMGAGRFLSREAICPDEPGRLSLKSLRRCREIRASGAVVVGATTALMFSVPVAAALRNLVEQVSSPTTSLPFAQVTGSQSTTAKHLGSVSIGLNGNAPRRSAAARRPPTAVPRRRSRARCRRRTTTPAGRAWPTTSPWSTAPSTATAPTAWTRRRALTPGPPVRGRHRLDRHRAMVQVHRQRRHRRHLHGQPAAGLTQRGHRRPAHRQRLRHQPVREHQRPRHRRLASLDHRHRRPSPSPPGSRP